MGYEKNKFKFCIKIELHDERFHDKKEHNYQPLSGIKMLWTYTMLHLQAQEDEPPPIKVIVKGKL
jgi:hypothetical protein